MAVCRLGRRRFVTQLQSRQLYTQEDGMTRLIVRIRRFIFASDGPTAVEYAVMLALIVIVCLASIRTLGRNVKTTFRNVSRSVAS